MGLVAHERFSGNLVERLHIDKAVNQTLLMQTHHVGGNATKSIRSLDALLNH